MSANADVELLSSIGSVILPSANSGNSSESITQQLGSGTYYVRVYAFNGNNTSYNLSLTGVALSKQIRQGSENVNFWLYDSNGRITDNSKNYIAPNRDTIVVIHGWNNNDQTETIKKLAIEATEFGQQVLALDWGGIANDPDELDTGAFGIPAPVPYQTAEWVSPVARWANEVLKNLGISFGQLTLIGHSLGTHVASEIGRIEQVKNLVALDPAFPGNNYNLDFYNKDKNQTPVRFDNESVAKYSLSFVIGDQYFGAAGDNEKAGTANDSFIIKNWSGNGFTFNAIDAHGAVVDLFRNALDRRLLNLNSLKSSRPNLIKERYDNNGNRKDNGLHEGSINAKFTGGEWRIDGLWRVVDANGKEELTWT